MTSLEYERRRAALNLPPDRKDATPEQIAALKQLINEYNEWSRILASRATDRTREAGLVAIDDLTLEALAYSVEIDRADEYLDAKEAGSLAEYDAKYGTKNGFPPDER